MNVYRSREKHLLSEIGGQVLVSGRGVSKWMSFYFLFLFVFVFSIWVCICVCFWFGLKMWMGTCSLRHSSIAHRKTVVPVTTMYLQFHVVLLRFPLIMNLFLHFTLWWMFYYFLGVIQLHPYYSPHFSFYHQSYFKVI